MRGRVFWAAGALVVLVVAMVLYGVLSRRPQPPSAPPVAALSVPGDTYIDRTVKAYLAAVISGDTNEMVRLNDAVVDPDVIRADTLGRFASVPAKYLNVRSVRDERVYSGNGAAEPATDWSAVATIESKRAGSVETLDVQLNGHYGSPGTVGSSMAIAAQ